MTETENQDEIDEIADRIIETYNEATKAKDIGDAREAGELFGEAADLLGQAIQLLKESPAEESRVDTWRTLRDKTRMESENLLANGASDVNMKRSFDIPELAPDLAVTSRNTAETPERGICDGSQESSEETGRSQEPSWAPTVSVVGLGEAGRDTVEMIDTESSARVYTRAQPGDIEDSDFLFISCDLREPRVEKTVLELMEAAENACTVLFSEGPAEDPEAIVDHVNLFFPVAVTGGDPRQFLSSTIADLFEAMLPPTVRELGKGDILSVAGERRLGRLFIDDLNDTSQLGNLTPGFEDGAVDAMLLFVCYDGPYPAQDVERKIMEYDPPDGAATLWDPRTRSRYQGRAHIKRIETSRISGEGMADLLRNHVA